MRNPWARRRRRQRMPNYLSKYRHDSDIAIKLINESSIKGERDPILDKLNHPVIPGTFLERFFKLFQRFKH